MSVHELQAPAGDGEVLVHPSWDAAAELTAHNRAALSQSPLSLLGRPLAEVRALARRQIWQQIEDYYRESGEPLPAARADSLLVGGHQPELFHPGVWLKNFALHRLARRLDASPLNLIVDSDTARNPVLRLPAGKHIANVPFDHWQSEVPFEERDVADETLFPRLPYNTRDTIQSWPFQPILSDFWIDVVAEGKRTPRVAERLVRARRAWERRWGLQPVELPVSRLCRTEAFAWFACHLLSEAAKLHEVYNAAVQSYRTHYGLRSHNHPVPDLSRAGDWLEVPLWGWRSDSPRRGKLFVRRAGAAIELRCGEATWPTLDASSPARLVETWLDLERSGFKVRTRALSLTLFTRLVVADLFVHGLGGGKYDEVTDGILRGFFGLEPPAFLVVTGTLRLPLPLHDVTPDDYRRLAWRVRDLAFNPQRHIDSSARLTPRDRDLLFTKGVLMRHQPLRHRDRKDRFFQMRQLNDALEPLVAEKKKNAEQEIAEISARLEENAIAARRDYAFCLYPEEKLRTFLRGEALGHVAVG